VSAGADRAAPSPADVAAELRERGVAAVALSFVDSATIARTKCVPIARFPEAAERGIGLSTLFNVAMSDDEFALAPGYIDGPSGDIRLRPDPAATVPIASMPGWAWAPVDQYRQDGTPFPACPRAFARRMLERAAAEGLSVAAAFELEFSLGLRSDDDAFVPAHRGPGYSDIALVENHPFALELITALEAQGLGLQQFHPEYADGQFELSIAPRDPVAAADASILIRQVVRSVASRHGCRASFSPQVAEGTGNGAHVHLSVWDGERNLLAGGDGPAGTTRAGGSFLAGVLNELPAIVAVSAPTVLSYLRLQPHHWSGATQCWGTENREAAIRFVAATEPSGAAAANMEVKPVDGTANPYLVVGSILAAGLHGVRTNATLPPSTEEDPSGLPEDVKDERGIRQLPASLGEAAEALAGSSVLSEAMGEFLFETYLSTRRREAERYADVPQDELIRRLRWRY
jgi:glutamine synthetase